MHILLFATATLSFLVQAPPASRFSSRPTSWPPCRMTHRARVFARLQDMPESIQADFLRRVGSVAGPDEAYNDTDVHYSGDRIPERRFLRGLRSGDHWFVWYEHGGFTIHRHVLAYSIWINGRRYSGPDRVQFQQGMVTSLDANLTGDPCGATDAVLDGVQVTEEF